MVEKGRPSRALIRPVLEHRAGLSQVQKAMSTNYATTEERNDETTISGPHVAADATGATYEYYQCECCGLETTDATVRSGCFRCGSDEQ